MSCPRLCFLSNLSLHSATVRDHQTLRWDTTDFSRLYNEEDELSEVTESDIVPGQVKDWLTSTFTRSLTNVRRRGDERLHFRSVANAIRAGIVVDRSVSVTAILNYTWQYCLCHDDWLQLFAYWNKDTLWIGLLSWIKRMRLSDCARQSLGSLYDRKSYTLITCTRVSDCARRARMQSESHPIAIYAPLPYLCDPAKTRDYNRIRLYTYIVWFVPICILYTSRISSNHFKVSTVQWLPRW